VSVVTSTTRNGKAASGRSQRERDIVTLRILRSYTVSMGVLLMASCLSEPAAR
jgi:hypothetical protein